MNPTDFLGRRPCEVTCARHLLIAVWAGAVVVQGRLGPMLEPQHKPGTHSVPIAPAALRLLLDMKLMLHFEGGGSVWWEISDEGESAVVAGCPFGGGGEIEVASWRRKDPG